MIIEKELTESKSLIKEINMCIHIKKEVLYLENDYDSIQLYDAIDNSETIDAPRIFIIIDFLNDRIRIIGGNISYVLSLKDLKILPRYPLNREREYSEYWYTNIIERGGLIFIEIECEILIANKDLEIIRVFAKYFNEQIVEIQEEVIILDSDGEEKRLYLGE